MRGSASAAHYELHLVTTYSQIVMVVAARGTHHNDVMDVVTAGVLRPAHDEAHGGGGEQLGGVGG